MNLKTLVKMVVFLTVYFHRKSSIFKNKLKDRTIEKKQRAGTILGRAITKLRNIKFGSTNNSFGRVLTYSANEPLYLSRIISNKKVLPN